jgi:hypothetical protein
VPHDHPAFFGLRDLRLHRIDCDRLTLWGVGEHLADVVAIPR